MRDEVELPQVLFEVQKLNLTLQYTCRHYQHEVKATVAYIKCFLQQIFPRLRDVHVKVTVFWSIQYWCNRPIMPKYTIFNQIPAFTRLYVETSGPENDWRGHLARSSLGDLDSDELRQWIVNNSVVRITESRIAGVIASFRQFSHVEQEDEVRTQMSVSNNFRANLNTFVL